MVDFETNKQNMENIKYKENLQEIEQKINILSSQLTTINVFISMNENMLFSDHKR